MKSKETEVVDDVLTDVTDDVDETGDKVAKELNTINNGNVDESDDGDDGEQDDVDDDVDDGEQDDVDDDVDDGDEQEDVDDDEQDDVEQDYSNQSSSLQKRKRDESSFHDYSQDYHSFGEIMAIGRDEFIKEMRIAGCPRGYCFQYWQSGECFLRDGAARIGCPYIHEHSFD